MFKAVLSIYFLICTGIGAWMGSMEWSGIAGILGGTFLGLAGFLCFSTLLAFFPSKAWKKQPKRDFYEN